MLLSFGGIDGIFGDIPAEVIYGGEDIFGPRWIALTFLSAAAIICLPRQFQVTVVENVDERHLGTASWLFPLYLFGMCLFIMPIAVAGLKVMPEGANPDLYVLTLPLHEGREELALLAFLGGFSSATSMVIVAAIAVSTMVSNHIVMPVALRFMQVGQEVSGDVRSLLLTSRRLSIGGVLGLGFLYFWLSGGDELARIGLIAFAGVAQFLPAVLGGLFWRGATRLGALAGLSIGGALWAYTLFLPSFGGDLMPPEMIRDGPWGIAALRPYHMLGLGGFDPLVHALIWSMGANVIAFLVVSASTAATTLERLQAAQFVSADSVSPGGQPQFETGTAKTEDLFILAQRILGADPARTLFDDMARRQGRATGLPAPTQEMMTRLERVLAGSVGAPSAHAMVGRVAGHAEIGVDALIDIADETQRLIETSRQLAEKSEELERAAADLGAANQRLRALDAQKDEFLSQVSHELRTPMTSIRSFSEILLDAGTVPEDRQRFLGIINEESLRLTRLLDEILDLSRLEAGTLDLRTEPIDLAATVAATIESVSGLTREQQVAVVVDTADGLKVRANQDRLRQVLINLLTNAVKYNTAADPRIRIEARRRGAVAEINVIDNGGGVSRQEAVIVFDKFARGRRSKRGQGAGLGLPISRAIMRTMGGDLGVVFSSDGSSFFRATLPLDRGPQQPAPASSIGIAADARA